MWARTRRGLREASSDRKGATYRTPLALAPRAADAAVGPAPPSGPAAAPASSLPTSLSSSTARRFVGRSGTRQQSSATRGAACS